MSVIKPFPHYEINVVDKSIYEPVVSETLPIHRPIWVMKAQQGPVGVPVWCPTYTDATSVFGEQTFVSSNSKYFSPQAYALLQSYTYNGAFIVRIADELAKNAMCILEAHVKAASITLYKKDADGNRLVDDEGEFVIDYEENPAYTEGGTEPQYLDTPKTVNGYNISFKTRSALTAPEIAAGGVESLAMSTKEDGTKVYPLMVFQSWYPGAYGNDLCFDLFFEKSKNNLANNTAMGSIVLTIAPKKRDYNKSTVTSLYNLYKQNRTDFAIKDDVLDPKTDLPYDMKTIIEKSYTGNYKLPFSIINFADSFRAIGNLIIEKETTATLGFTKPNDFNVGTSELGYLVNIVSGLNYESQPFDSIAYLSGNDTVMLKDGVHIYLGSGNDGDLGDVMVETGVKAFYRGTLNPTITNKNKYPFNYVFDMGHTRETKFAMMDFAAIRDDVKINISTQIVFDDGTGIPITKNNQSVDESFAAVLRSYALLMRESIVKGTECCRIDIFQQAGYPVSETYKKILPYTLWSAIKHAQYQNTDRMAVEPRGNPNNLNLLFKDVNWDPNDDETASRLWDTGVNYCQSADMKRFFYPSIRSVYRYDTSALVDAWFVDFIVYCKHEVRQCWTTHVGRNEYTGALQELLRKDLVSRISRLSNGKYRFDVIIYQSEEEAKLGYVQHVLLKITAPNTFRVMDVDIEVYREGYEG